MADLVPFPSRRHVSDTVVHRAHRIANKLQRLCLDYPMEAEVVEEMIDRIITKHAAQDEGR